MQLMMTLSQSPFVFSSFLTFQIIVAYLVCFTVLIISFSLYFQFLCLGIDHETLGTLGRREFRTISLWIKLGERGRRDIISGCGQCPPQCFPYTEEVLNSYLLDL